MSRAFVFPGQGSQAVGMGRELAEAFAEARHVFQEVDEALSQNLSKLMFEGPEDTLTLTENAQPALMAMSVAVVRVLEGQGKMDLAKTASFVAGHSLGEYSALAAVGTFSLADTARLLKLRGQSMQKAVPVGVGAMAALLGSEYEQAKEIAALAAEGQVCEAANDNGAGQVVVSGHKEAVERAMKIAAEKGIKRAVLLPVSAPFHCALMQPAADAMAEALSNVTMNAPKVPLVANVVASAVTDPEVIRDLLVKQVTGTVRWREGVLYMKEQGVSQLVELGAGKVLSGLAKRIDKELSGLAVGNPADIDAFLASL
ncbi:ACP S-malonyltransferase [Magnetospirillum gryphiswaldense]|uniref:Malonyl CoA-acyl carrier protein transacylase n=2 Tax=Magnetospirillum gryphiswaldense TaxID=55518 RepID=V6EZM2_MAGGM|nr:ACP S-malonyltransferase [Magnetospirillum gryphiswaldense]AVM73266.1 Malonyl CoA-acyl carrier protein transacylase [Magnetospirillum gryphiswaldense MSR-1]AVM77169.1 Malonyl CoA-acyl carrier protein transacylase [Magnetospirillum gryphiswaldense]CAM75911.1 malonyl CoA-acyl carrier protein transacylase [Magnetospirillum gryphiswaldense MSR-1]CDK98700.1 Malonyl CoA-acyl carrier protein transacylase (MCT) [Magnetospirillum gryphiswaldense MSR-1 v2]